MAPPTQNFRQILATRRAFVGGAATLPLLSVSGCSTANQALRSSLPSIRFPSVARTTADTITVPYGYRNQVLIAWGDPLFENVGPFDPDALTRTEQERRFGQNNDMLALFPEQHAFPWPTDQRELILCVNNEYSEPALAFPALGALRDLTPARWEALLAGVGVSIVRVRNDDGVWSVVRDTAPGGVNRRITPFTPVVFSGPAARHRWIVAATPSFNEAERASATSGTVSCGTLANCSGGRTPWGTFLSSEENFDGYFYLTDVNAAPLAAAAADTAWLWDAGRFGYPLFTVGGPRLAPAQFDVSRAPHGPALYGWVLEVDPYDPQWTPRKRTALGRKKGECANTAISRDGRVAVYMGDDQIDHFVFKFVTRGRFDPGNRHSNRDLLDDGVLYAARFNEDGTGDWLELSVDACNRAIEDAPYHATFADPGDVAMRAREAASLLGATPMDRPEDVEAPVDHDWKGLGFALVVCTYNRNEEFYRPGNPRRGAAQSDHVQQSNVGGHIIRIDEARGDHAATTFRWEVFALCGDPDASEQFMLPGAISADVSVTIEGRPTIAGDRFTCPDNICFDSTLNVWIATDGSPAVFPDCNDSVVVTPTATAAPRPVKRFLVAPVGAEVCGPTLSPDERAFLCSIQHPGENDLEGTPIQELRWRRGRRPPSDFPDGAGAWPRSAVVVVTRDDGGVVSGA